MCAPLDLLSGWKYAGTGTGSGCPTAPSTAGAAQGRNEVQGLFRETGAPGSGAFGGRPPVPRPVSVLGVLRPHQLSPARDGGGHFDAVPETEQAVPPAGRGRGAVPAGQVCWAPLPSQAGVHVKAATGEETRCHRRETRA